MPVSSIETRIADIVMSRAYYCGREGDYVTAEDRDNAAYLDCQNAAGEILALEVASRSAVAAVITEHVGSDPEHSADAALHVSHELLSHALSNDF